MKDINYEDRSFIDCREWIASAFDEGHSWDEIKTLLVPADQFESRFEELSDDGQWPTKLHASMWSEYVDHYRSHLVMVAPPRVEGIDGGISTNIYSAPTHDSSAWVKYMKSLDGKISPASIANLRSGCEWTLQHLREDTRKSGPVKGLVTGSVQSGKTANMEGLICMAADYGWNFFIVLSGTIDNLRKQTRDRFKEDLKEPTESVRWEILDFAGEDKHFAAEDLCLNSLSGSKSFAHRYVTVVLKNKSRLNKLIDWLYEDRTSAGKLRVLIIDDEADQASINTAAITAEEEQERRAINQLIVNLANGRRSDGSKPEIPLQAINYISYTATPYANVLNEASEESLYPKDFICTLPEAKEYFGARVIFGNNEEEGCPGFNIVRDIPEKDEKELKLMHDGGEAPSSLKDAIAWFLCASATLRKKGHRKSISMLVHTTPKQDGHFGGYESIERWLRAEEEVIGRCRSVYADESASVNRESLREANSDYPDIDRVKEFAYDFELLLPEIRELLREITNIRLGDEGKLTYSSGIHLCVDNCGANRESDEGMHLRIVYPTATQLEAMEKAPVFLVIGGNTLSRGLTLDGLVCTYFARNVNQADTLMQMARWFGYRKGYELLQRIWMNQLSQQKYRALAKIDMDLKDEVNLFMERGIPPAKFGPRIRNTPEITRFLVSAKNKTQSAGYGDFDFCGDSYETTIFNDDETLTNNLTLLASFAKKELAGREHKRSPLSSAEVWRGIPFAVILDAFISKYQIAKESNFSTTFKTFLGWMATMNDEGKFLRWNVAIVDGANKERKWEEISGLELGYSERTMKKGKSLIDLHSLRSGRDVICDIDLDNLPESKRKQLKDTKKSGKGLISRRCDYGLEDTPLLLIYLIKKDGGKEKSGRKSLNAHEDIVGISVIVSGESIGNSHARTLQIKMGPNSEVL